MALMSLPLVDQALALPPAERQELAILLLESVRPEDPDEPTHAEWCEILRQGFEDLESEKDPGSTFEEVFGEPL